MRQLTGAIAFILALAMLWLAAPEAARLAGLSVPCTIWPASHFACGGTQTAADVLQRRPLAAVQWLMLAETAARESGKQDTFRQALSMAFLAAPNEGNVILPRVMLGLANWSQLDRSLKERVARDTAIGWQHMTAWHMSRLTLVIAAMPEQERIDMQTLLAGTRGMSPEALRRIGLLP